LSSCHGVSAVETFVGKVEILMLNPFALWSLQVPKLPATVPQQITIE
jgi:hypothetical protein